MQYNRNDSQVLFRCSVCIILKMASPDTLFLCSAGQEAWLCSNQRFCSYKIILIKKESIIVIMMKENDDIFLAGADPLVYLAQRMHKKYSAAFVWGHSFSTYISHDQFFNAFHAVRTCTHFGWLHSIPPVAYVLNGWPILYEKNKW